MDFDKVVYKYRDYSARSLEILINRELYFASPDQLNDPFDCQLNIRGALEVALQEANSESDDRGHDRLIKFRDRLPDLWPKMEKDIKSVGILSLVADGLASSQTLMWTHYANNHRGFRLGFQFPETWSANQSGNQMIGRAPVVYEPRNPFIPKLREYASSESEPPWDPFWLDMLETGVVAKFHDWKYEGEERVIRKGVGVVPFVPSYLVEVVFGGRMSPEDERALRNLLSHKDWSHVKLKRAIRPANHDFGVEIVEA